MKELHKAKMTANMVMVTDANGQPSASDKITKTELNMLNNVRSNIQTQIDAKAEKIDKYVDYSAAPYLISSSHYNEDTGLWISSGTAPYDCVAYVQLQWLSSSTSTSTYAYAYINVDDVQIFIAHVSSRAIGSANMFPILLKAGQTLTIMRFNEFKNMDVNATCFPWGS